jgi:hypothetical protein
MSTEQRAAFAELAHQYAQLGWPLVRLEGKRPKDPEWQRATADEPGAAAGKWSHWGGRYNLGAVLGDERCVFEYDAPEAEARFLELLGGDLPATPVCRTGSGKLHVYFAANGVTRKAARDGLELRVGAHQCVLPPSTHPDTGKPYEWLPGHEPWAVPLLDVPASVAAFFDGAAERQRDALRAGEKVRTGARRETLFRFACMQRRWTDEEEAIVATCLRWNERHCEPLLSEGQVREQVRGAMKMEGGQELAGDEEPFALDVLTAKALCELPGPPESGHLLGPLVVSGQRVILGGHTGEGKTTAALLITRAIVAAESFLEWTGTGGRALFLDAEQGLRTIQRRLAEAGLDSSELVDYVRVPDGLSLDSDPRHVAEVERVLTEGRYALVVIDPLYKLHTGDSNAEREAVDLMKRLDGWREALGFALLLPVHCRKPVPGTKFSIHDLFGSSAYVRGAEVVLGLQRVSDGYARLHFLKDRDGDLPIHTAWGLLFDREQGFRRDPNEGRKPTALDQVRELLAEEPGLSTAQLVEITGYKERTIRKAVSDLSEEASKE